MTGTLSLPIEQQTVIPKAIKSFTSSAIAALSLGIFNFHWSSLHMVSKPTAAADAGSVTETIVPDAAKYISRGRV